MAGRSIGSLRSTSKLAVAGALAIAACHKGDWREEAIASAQREVRLETGDPGATFAAVQITGDQFSGQVCGRVTAHDNTILSGHPARFIFYIDRNGGNNPWVEGNPGPHVAPNFEFNWNADCVREGYVEATATR